VAMANRLCIDDRGAGGSTAMEGRPMEKAGREELGDTWGPPKDLCPDGRSAAQAPSGEQQYLR
jgi:hypothetical protein